MATQGEHLDADECSATHRTCSGLWKDGEIRAIKIWRANHGLDFPSFYLELIVLDALAGCGSSVANNVQRTLGYIADNLTARRVEDPANTNNTVSGKPNLDHKRPDVIIHRRGSHKDNLLVVEVKRDEADVDGDID